MGDGGDDKSFASNYMLLNAKDVGVKGLCHVLASRNASKKKRYIDTHKDSNVVHNWLLFISLALQKLLLLISAPLGWLGCTLETALNLLSNNRGFLGLVFNTLRLKLVIPDKESVNYKSVIAHMDSRVKIDPTFEICTPRYNEALALLASKIAYENKAYIKHVVEDRWKMELIGAYDFWNDYLESYTTQAFIFRQKRGDEELIVVAFRGTEPFNAQDWCSDFDVSWYKFPKVGKVHAGFLKALGLQKNRGWPKDIDQDPNRPAVAYYYIRTVLRQLLKDNSKAKFMVTGHSLGGALAILFPSVLAIHNELDLLDRIEAVYTFGQPRAGNAAFGNFVLNIFQRHDVKYIRFVYCNDMVPRVPYDDSGLLFRHFGDCLYYNSIYQGDFVKEEPFKNYFSIFGIIPMTLNALWEIARAFIYPYTKGESYREGWLMFIMRIFGLILPGVSAHIPRDYHNSTRLGSMVSRLHHKIEDKIDSMLHLS